MSKTKNMAMNHLFLIRNIIYKNLNQTVSNGGVAEKKVFEQVNSQIWQQKFLCACLPNCSGSCERKA